MYFLLLLPFLVVYGIARPQVNGGANLNQTSPSSSSRGSAQPAPLGQQPSSEAVPPPEIHLPPLPRDYPSRLICFHNPPGTPNFEVGVEIGQHGLDGTDLTMHEDGGEAVISNLYGQAVLLIQGKTHFGSAFTVAARFALNNPLPVTEAIVRARDIVLDNFNLITSVTTIAPRLNGDRTTRLGTDISRTDAWIFEFQQDIDCQLPGVEATQAIIYPFTPITPDMEHVRVLNYMTTDEFRRTLDPGALEVLLRTVEVGDGMMAPPPPTPPTPLAVSTPPDSVREGGRGFLGCLAAPFSCCFPKPGSDSSDLGPIEMKI